MKKSIGIIGGMGSLATSDLFNKIVALTKASNDSEHIRIFIDNNPSIPDRTAAILHGGESPVPAMAESLSKLEAAGANCIIMPCNTAHYFLPKLKSRTALPFISMLDMTAEACAAMFPGKTAAILATEGTIKSNLYQNALSSSKVPFLVPSSIEAFQLMEVIYSGVKSGLPAEGYCSMFTDVLKSMAQRGADYYILGCTELPIAFDAVKADYPAVDPTTELAKAAIQFCGYEVKE